MTYDIGEEVALWHGPGLARESLEERFSDSVQEYLHYRLRNLLQTLYVELNDGIRRHLEAWP